MQAVLIKKNADQTIEIIKRGEYPNLDMEPVQGLDPDLEWLLVYEPFVQPDYDPRIYVIQRNEEITQVPHPQYSHLNQFKVTFLLVKRAVEEINVSIANAEALANESLLKYEERLKILTLGLAVLFRKTDGSTLLAKEIAIRDKVVALGTRIWKNDANAQAMITAIQSQTEPNLDEGWEKE